MAIQDSLQRKFSKISKKLYDYKYIKVLGTNATQTFILEITQDDFKNSYTIIKDYKPIWCRIEFPGKEVPLMMNTDDNNQSSTNTLMLYEILPIEGYFLSTDNVKLGNVIFYKYKLKENDFQIIPLQLVNLSTKGGISDSLINQYILAPPTDYSFTNDPIYKTLLEKFRNENNW